MHTIGLLLLTLSTMACVDAKNMMCKVCMSFVKVVQPIVEKGGNIVKAIFEKCATSAPGFIVPHCKNILEKVADFSNKTAHVTPELACIRFKACKAEKVEGRVGEESASSKT